MSGVPDVAFPDRRCGSDFDSWTVFEFCAGAGSADWPFPGRSNSRHMYDRAEGLCRGRWESRLGGIGEGQCAKDQIKTYGADGGGTYTTRLDGGSWSDVAKNCRGY